MPIPTKDKWIEISNKMFTRSNFPHCLGAIDGKHIRMMCPKNTGSEYFNYKKFYSIVLLAIADSDYCFTAVDVGSNGRESDSNILKSSAFGQLLDSNPKLVYPFVFVDDEAFGLNTNLLRPYPRRNFSHSERVFNYRLTRARLVECTFGILTSKWRIFLTPILLELDFTELLTKTACVLYNFVRRRDGFDFNDTLRSTTRYIGLRNWVTIIGNFSQKSI
ncbi:uncharacterized protein [Diabrotica undecimpunctata]|uniref:uncharacterized protein n=1 Tax=Diabrotica undecimpunctata TaxID=50387 RepID=UPI003B640942